MLLNIDRGQRPALLAAYNEICRSGDIPAEWRSAIVVPIHKKGKPQGVVTSSYRPLTSAAGKILEAVALHRLEWIAAVREALSPEQSGFRAGRCTADCIAQVVCMLEQAKAERQEAYLVLLDVRSAFDMLPHEAIMDALRWLGVSARLLRYVEAFLTGRTFQVRVGSTCSTERAVTKGVPQGSVISPFLFYLALARLPLSLPSSKHSIRVAIYADDIAIVATAPTLHGPDLRREVQASLDAISRYLTGIGLSASPEKTVAMLFSPRRLATNTTPPLQLQGTPLPWQHRGKYLGLSIDSKLSYKAAVGELRLINKRVAAFASRLLARGEGATPTLPLRLYEGTASARVLYALPLLQLRPAQWEQLDRDQRTAMRRFAGLPKGFNIGPTHAELCVWPVSLRAERTALNHIERLHRATGTAEIIADLRASPRSRMGQARRDFDFVVRAKPAPAPPRQPPHRAPALRIETTIPGVQSKQRTPHCAIRQETAQRVELDYASRVHLYTDGSVSQDGNSATAACTAPAIGITKQCRVRFFASSTTAEISALHLAADVIAETPDLKHVAMLSDSRSALVQLQRPYRAA
ncbi:hypothetical protein V5799_024371, partial [Amblyomma americanum]